MTVSVNRGRLTRALCLLSILLLGAGRASATSLISFTDPNPTFLGSLFFLRDQNVSWAISWTQTVSASNVTLEAWIARSGPSVPAGALGEAYLMSAIGLGTTAASEVVAPVSFTTPLVGEPLNLDAVAPVTLFTGLNLGPGTYYLVLGGPASLVVGDPFDWLGDRNPTATTAAGFSVGSRFVAAGALNSFEPNNTFNTSTSGQPFFRLTAVEQDATVPEPSTLLLIGSGVAAAIRARKRNRV
jgi:hypothetical protein